MTRVNNKGLPDHLWCIKSTDFKFYRHPDYILQNTFSAVLIPEPLMEKYM